MMSLFRLRNVRCGELFTLMLFLGLAFGYGLWVEALAPSATTVFRLALVVAIMHFWYDGFIWSVRKNQI